MSLQERISDDMKSAMKAGDAARTGVLRLLTAALQNRAIEKRGTGQGAALSDEDAIAVCEKEVKKRREAAELYTKGGRGDLAEQELREAGMLEAYLPPKASDADIEAVIAHVARGGAADFSSLMKGAMQELRGRADGRRVGELVKKALGK
jgi:uncharacterized protein YqeY